MTDTIFQLSSDGCFKTPEVVINFIQSVAVIVNVVFALAVWKDIRSLQRQGKSIQLVHPIIWEIATILLGVITVAVYWIIHHFPIRSITEVPSESKGATKINEE